MPTPYDSILNLPHPVSKKHPQMSIADRAAQFAPFAALTGYGAAITETGRLTDEKRELDECEKAALNEKLLDIRARSKSRPVVRFTCFLPDAKKAGGVYADVTGAVRRLDNTAQAVIMTDGTRVPFDDIVAISEAEGPRMEDLDSSDEIYGSF